jgi:hypothetical protein
VHASISIYGCLAVACCVDMFSVASAYVTINSNELWKVVGSC